MIRKQRRSTNILLIAAIAMMMTAIGSAQQNSRKRDGGQDSPGSGPRNLQGGLPSPQEILTRLDKNGDGQLSKDELPAAFADRLMRADLNGDGLIIEEELLQARQRMGQQAAGQGQIDPAQFFRRLDTNSDGKLSKDELPKLLAEELMRADSNGDGDVTREELAAATRQLDATQAKAALPNAAEILKQLDKNGDGELSKEELPERFGRLVLLIDENGDGVVTKSELEAGQTSLTQAITQRPGNAPAARAGQGDPGKLFDLFDKNGDGRVSKDELPAGLAERMLKADQDGDGSITKDELKRLHQRFQERGRSNRP